MKLTHSVTNTAQAVFLTILISVPWGATVGTFLSLFNDDPATKWHHLAMGGALLAPIMALVFETPLQNLVALIARIPFMWVVLLPFVLLRFMFSVVPALIANRIATTGTKATIVLACPFEGVVRIQSSETVQIAQATYANNDVVFEIQDDWSVRQDRRLWGCIGEDGNLMPNQATLDRASGLLPPAWIQYGKLWVNEKAVGVLIPKG